MAGLYEIWIDVVCRGSGRLETLCTLFGDIDLPFRPAVGETLSFMSDREHVLEYVAVNAIATCKSSSIRVDVDEISHYSVNESGSVLWKTSIRCSEISVQAENDGMAVCEFMTRRHGFSLDPYGVNILYPDVK